MVKSQNQKHWQCKITEADGALDKQVLDAAFGETPAQIANAGTVGRRYNQNCFRTWQQTANTSDFTSSGHIIRAEPCFPKLAGVQCKWVEAKHLLVTEIFYVKWVL